MSEKSMREFAESDSDKRITLSIRLKAVDAAKIRLEYNNQSTFRLARYSRETISKYPRYKDATHLVRDKRSMDFFGMLLLKGFKKYQEEENHDKKRRC